MTGWVLIAPMLLNGPWTFCDHAQSGFETTLEFQGLSDEAAECARPCLREHQVGTGEICLILPSDASKSMAIVDFGVAILAHEIQLQPPAVIEAFITELRSLYSNPSVISHAPPPKA